MLASIEDSRKDITSRLAQAAQDYLDGNGYAYHMSIQNYDEFGFEDYL